MRCFAGADRARDPQSVEDPRDSLRKAIREDPELRATAQRISDIFAKAEPIQLREALEKNDDQAIADARKAAAQK